jgi:hypothetical protein
MPTLVITINGPFAYVENYPKEGLITLMAPMCPQHVAGIASIEAGNQVIFNKTQVNCRNHPANLGHCDAHLYELRIKHGKVTSSSKKGGIFLPCPKPPKDFDPKAWRFWLTLPNPNELVAVNPVKANIIAPKAANVPNGPYAVGARLIYKKWNGKPPSLWYENSSQQPQCLKTFTFSTYDDHAYLEIEYSSPLRDDPDHEDAVDCFENLMDALELPWTVYIPPQTTILGQQTESSKLNDCIAPIGLVGG